jgi:hypothetical protein
VFLTVIVVNGAAAQKPIKPSSPAVEAPPAWSRVMPMPDGRTFVTDGGLAIDAAIAKPSALPSTALPAESGKIITGYLTTKYEQEVGLSELRSGKDKNRFVTPGGVILNGNYVSFLRRTVSAARLGVRGDSDPIVILLDGQPIGVLMPVRR